MKLKDNFIGSYTFKGNFEHLNYKNHEFEKFNKNGKRHYYTDEGSFPSITTILGHLEKDWLKEWVKRVGEIEAARISKRAADNGTKIHLYAEKYLKNEIIEISSIIDVKNFKSMKAQLDLINNIRLQESSMYSLPLKIAGTVDCIADYDGKLSVIDFKTSRSDKMKEQIDDYFIQCAAYAHMYKYLYKENINNLVVLIVSDGETKVFKEDISSWNQRLHELLKSYWRAENERN